MDSWEMGELQTVGTDFGTGSLRVDPRKTSLLLVTLFVPFLHIPLLIPNIGGEWPLPGLSN